MVVDDRLSDALLSKIFGTVAGSQLICRDYFENDMPLPLPCHHF